jgi:hypothetical protein
VVPTTIAAASFEPGSTSPVSRYRQPAWLSEFTAFMPDIETTLARFGEEIIKPYANA